MGRRRSESIGGSVHLINMLGAGESRRGGWARAFARFLTLRSRCLVGGVRNGYPNYSWGISSIIGIDMDFGRPFNVVTPTLDGDVLGVLAGAEEEFTGRRIHQVLERGS
jgi:hypothetical protein